MTLEQALIEIIRLQARIDELEYIAGYWEQAYYTDIVNNDKPKYVFEQQMGA